MNFKELEVELAIQLHNAGIGVYGTSNPSLRTIFVGEWDQTIVEGIMLIPVQTPPPHEYVDTEYKIIDFWARSPHSDRAKALLRNVFEFYFRRSQFSTGNWYIYFSKILGDITDVDRDEENGKLYRLSVQFICRNLNHFS